MDKRTRGRELAMQVLYQLDVQGGEVLGWAEQFFIENEPDPEARALALEWTKGAWRDLEECDQLITEAALKWKLSRLSMVDKSILRLSVYQLRFCPDIPDKVVINEAVELAKKFSSSQAGRFVNGVLDAVARKLRNTQKI